MADPAILYADGGGHHGENDHQSWNYHPEAKLKILFRKNPLASVIFSLTKWNILFPNTLHKVECVLIKMPNFFACENSEAQREVKGWKSHLNWSDVDNSYPFTALHPSPPKPKAWR